MMVERATYELAESSFLENLVCNIEHEKQRCTTYLLLGNRVHYTHIVDAKVWRWTLMAKRYPPLTSIKKGAYIAKDELSRMLGGIPEGTFQGNLKDVLAENLLNDRTKWSKTFLKLDMTHVRP